MQLVNSRGKIKQEIIDTSEIEADLLGFLPLNFVTELTRSTDDQIHLGARSNRSRFPVAITS